MGLKLTLILFGVILFSAGWNMKKDEVIITFAAF
jgi:hypothetical protein